MYHALYRKYRPQDFDSVVGQNVIIKTLKNSIINHTFTHAYMFFGPRGTGKTTISKIFARTVNCLNPIDGISCGKCDNCLASYNKECVDIIEIDAASNNGVDEIRELKSKVSLVPAELKYKVYIIDEVHMLSIGAFNALLKTLEEPPEHVIFILATTDPQKVPETIISRCQCFSFKRISTEMIVEKLKYVCSQEHIEIEDDVLNEIAINADGGMRDALGMLDKLYSYTSNKITMNDFAELNGVVTHNELMILTENLLNLNISDVLNLINVYNNEGKNLVQIFSQLMYYLRNMIVDYYINNINLDFSLDKIIDLVNLINENLFDIKKSGNPKIYIEILLISFMRKYGISAEDKTKKDDVYDKQLNNIKDNSENLIVEKNNSDDNRNLDNFNLTNSINIDIDNNENNKIDDSFMEIGKIINIDEIINARVNNTLAMANKDILKRELENFNLLNDFTFDQEIGYIVCSLLDAKVRAASEENIIISYEYDGNVEQNLNYLNKMNEVYNKITNSNKKLAIITDERWEKEKNNYIKAKKNGNVYKIIEEPEEVLEEINKNDIITGSSAVALFGDIVEIE